MEKLAALFKKYQDIIIYLIFGVLTTVINLVVYSVGIYFGMNVQIATILAWIVAVIFAYLTNRKWVFHSTAHTPKEIGKEATSFTLSRLSTLLVDMAIIWFGVQLLGQNPFIWKIIDNVVVVILNYVLSKVMVFKDHD
ncbi:GtrA family protein [Weissella viridescens]|uniref:GtrA family protein n=2 Tax=Weissella viridescens TaxID=1629 RepID=A0A3P2RLR5_WEIVI|nr:GtrA family protein [Weissella viridescens]